MRNRIWAYLTTVVMSLAVVGVTLASGADLTPSERARIEKEVLAANTEMNRAADGLDVDRFFDWILDEADGPIIQDGRLFETRDEALAVVRQGYRGIGSLHRTYQKTHVTVLSKDAALVTTSGSTRMELLDGRSIQAPFAASFVFVLRDGAWKILQGHYSVPNR